MQLGRKSRIDVRWLRLWLIGLNVLLLAAALWLGFAVSRRGFLLAGLVPVAFAPFSYARARLHRTLTHNLDISRAAPLAVLGCLLDAVMVAELLTSRSPATFDFLRGPFVAWIGPVWFSAFAFLFVGYALAALLRGAARLGAKAATVARPRAASPETALAMPERREFLRQFGVVGAGVPFFVSLSGVRLSYDFRVEEKEIVLPHWPAALDGLRVAHLSDIHVGGEMNRERLFEVARLTNESRPDLVLHTGDFLTHRAGNFDAPLYEALAAISAPLGQWACLGNHDYDDPIRFVEKLRGAGVTVLRDRLARIAVRGRALEIAGLDYVLPAAGREAAYHRRVGAWKERGDTPRILLNHDPSGFFALPDDAADLVLSGHTHGGHVGVQLGPSAAVTVIGLVGLPDQGVFTRGPMRMFVTRCVGFYGYPMRVGIPPEIALLTLRAPRLGLET